MPESRGAASVTLDTIIAKALADCEYRSAGMGEEAQTIGDLYTPEGCALIRSQAVTDALLAKGHVIETAVLSAYIGGTVGAMLVIPLEAS